MASQKTELDKAITKRSELESVLAERLAAVAVAQTDVSTIDARISTGDEDVSPLDLLKAQGALDIAEKRRASTADELDRARELETSLTVDRVVAEVAADVDSINPEAVDKAIEMAKQALAGAVADLAATFRDRDRLCNAAGEKLAAAGVPVGQRVGRVSYAPVTFSPQNRRPVPGQWNVRLDGEHLARRDEVGATRNLIERAVQVALENALAQSGLKWTSRGVTGR